MKKYDLHKQIYFLLSLIFIASCNGQDNAYRKLSGSKDSVSELKTIPARQPKMVKTQGTDKYDNVHCSLLDKAGNLWFGTTGEGVYSYDGKSFINFTEKDGLCSNNVWSILEDTAGKIWFGTSDGVCHFDGKSFTRFQVLLASASTLLQDKAGNLWFGTDYSGVYRYDGKSFTNFLSGADTWHYDKRKYQVVQCMFEDKNGKIWLGSWNNGGVFRYDGKSFTNFTTNDGFCDNMISGILEDKTGNILFATRDEGVCCYDGKSFTNFSEKIGLANNNIRCILEDKKGNIWFGTDGKEDNDGNGVYRYDGKSLTNFTTKDGLSNNNVFTIIEDKTGNIWFGTRDIGLCRYDGKSFTDFMEKGSK